MQKRGASIDKRNSLHISPVIPRHPSLKSHGPSPFSTQNPPSSVIARAGGVGIASAGGGKAPWVGWDLHERLPADGIRPGHQRNPGGPPGGAQPEHALPDQGAGPTPNNLILAPYREKFCTLLDSW